MKKKVIINPCASFKKKEGVYAFYLQYNFYFLKDNAAKLMDLLLDNLEIGGDLEKINEEFIAYLIQKQILLEVANE